MKTSTSLASLRPFIHRWNRVPKGSNRILLRLAILHDLFRFLHAEKSRLLVSREQKTLSNLSLYSERLLLARNATELNGSLLSLLSGQWSPKSVHIPSSLPRFFSHIGLGREDRKWELTIATQARKAGWDFYFLESEIEIQKAQKYHERLLKLLPPSGIVLFAESISAPTQADHWRGQWLCIVKQGAAAKLKKLGLKPRPIARRVRR